VASILAGSGVFSTSYMIPGHNPNVLDSRCAAGANVISLRCLTAKAPAQIRCDRRHRLGDLQQGVDEYPGDHLSLGRPFTVSYKKDPLCQRLNRHGRRHRRRSRRRQLWPQQSRPPRVRHHQPRPARSSGHHVGAVNTRGTTNIEDHVVASYSSKGPTAIDHIAKPDLVAPGNKIYATQCKAAR